MTWNVGKTDRLLRVGIGITLIVFGVVISGTYGMIIATIGVIPLGTGLAGNCPVYTLFGIKTCRPRQK